LRFVIALLFASFAPQTPNAFPPLGIIDFYGLRTIPQDKVLGALPYHVGDTILIDQFKSQKQTVQQQIASQLHVRGAFLTLVCCTSDRKSMLYVGIEEANSACLGFKPSPSGTVRLTGDVLNAGRDFDVALQNSVLKGNVSEDDSQGHALDGDPDVRVIQLRIVILADAHLENLKDVLENSSDSGQRALAAQVLGYVKNKQAIVPDLVTAMRDSDPNVRNNAARALLVFAEFSPKPATPKIKISWQPFIDLLNSCVWSDRNKSSGALAQLSETRDPVLQSELRQKALPSLIEMAQWKSIGHAWFSLMILGRIGGLTDDEIQKDLDREDRTQVVAAAIAATKTGQK